MASTDNKTIYLSLLTGLILGAASWVIVPFVSNSFEPFDSEPAFYIGQSFLSLAAFLIGFIYGMKPLFVFILGVYLSNNIYPFIFGTSESRAWAGLGLITVLFLCIYPLFAGILGKISNLVWVKFTHNNAIKKDV
jgi:hypothetical protein